VGERAAGEAAAFARHGTAVAMRVEGSQDAAAVAERALELRADEARLRKMGARGAELVDGRGAERVAAALRKLAGADALSGVTGDAIVRGGQA
jgi:hypothetical protein